MSLTKDDLAILCEPFDESKIGVKIQSISKNKDRALLVLYLQHTDVYERLEKVDPNWASTSLSVSEVNRDGERLIVCRMRLTLKGVSRENSGEGYDEKAAFSDAIKRCAMLFGVGRYLYDQETAWVPYNEKTDKYKTWTLEDHRKATRGNTSRSTGSSGALHLSGASANKVVQHGGDAKGTSVPAHEDSISNAREFIIGVGSLKGKAIKEISKEQAKEWVTKFKHHLKQGVNFTPDWIVTANKLSEYVKET